MPHKHLNPIPTLQGFFISFPQRSYSSNSRTSPIPPHSPKMQKSIYRVRGQARLAARIALDMLREARAHARQQTTDSLHDARAG